MRILIDENLPRQLKRMLSEHVVFTVQEMGWAGIRNSELLIKAEVHFDVLLTADKSLRYQQNLSGLKLAIIIFPTNRLKFVEALVPRVEYVLSIVDKGKVVEL